MAKANFNLRRAALMGSAATMLATFATGVGVTGAYAQDSDADTEEVEEVVVTGSRIKSTNISSPSPVTSIGGAEVDIRGITRVEELLQTLPQTVASNGSGNFGGAGVANVNLRGLGNNRTLVLVDGRRLPFGQSNSVAADLNQIPSQLVERVDVLTGGASAVYGADAVAGVVNFIMKRDFEGLTVNGQVSVNQTANDSDRFEAILEGGGQPVPDSALDGFTWSTDIIVGANTADGRGNVTAAFTYREANEILQNQRIASACAFGGGDPEFVCLGSSTTRPARITDFGLADVGFDLLAFDETTGLTRDIILSGQPNDTFNFASTQRTRAPSERFTINVFSHYEIADGVELYMDLAFSDNTSTGQIGPSGNFFVTNQINCNNPFLTPGQIAAICDANGVSTVTDFDANPNGIGEENIATAFVGRRNVEGGPRQFDFSNTTFRVTGGVRGDINDNWSYDVNGQFARVTNQRVVLNDLIDFRLQRSLLVVADPDTGAPVCASVLDGSDANCVPWNIFSPGGITQEALDYISVPTFESGSVRQEILNTTFVGDLGDYGFTLPWAETAAQFVGGFEYRNDSLDRQADDFLASGQVAGAGGATLPVEGNVNVYEFFGELAVPIIEGAEFAEELSATLAYRFSDYNTTGTASTYALGLTYSPTSDIRIRGQYQRAVRAPNIFELFLGQNTGLFDLSDPDGDGVFDPCAGPNPSATLAQCMNTGVTAAQFGNVPDNPAGQFNQITGGNPDLDVETSDTFTVGAVITPEAVPGLTLSIDYFNIEVTDFVGTIPPQLTLTNCLETGDPFFCSLIQRDAGGSLFVDGNTSFIVATNVNTGSIQTDGIDINASYNFDIGDGWGNLGVVYAATWLNSYEVISIPGEDPFECAGFYSSSCVVPRPEFSHRALATWSTENNVDVSLTWRRVGAVRLFGAAEDSTNLSARLGAQNYFDVSVSVGLADGVRARLGINNLFDNLPPVSSALPAGLGTGNTFPSVYDAEGRLAFLAITADF